MQAEVHFITFYQVWDTSINLLGNVNCMPALFL
uniref:Uncharacterized protein n=1 Tax=Anguilla anguilla TaxID=7936 RepID=A0A0E9UMR7_ANGAN